MNSKLTINPLVENKFEELLCNYRFITLHSIVKHETKNMNTDILNGVIVFKGEIDTNELTIEQNPVLALPTCTIEKFTYIKDEIRNQEIAQFELEQIAINNSKNHGLFVFNLAIVIMLLSSLFAIAM